MSPLSIDAGRDDVLRVARLLADRLPDPLRPVAAVAYNYGWTWALGASAGSCAPPSAGSPTIDDSRRVVFSPGIRATVAICRWGRSMRTP